VVDGALYLDGEDVLAARDEHLLTAAHDSEVALLVDAGQVACPQPAVPQDLGRSLGSFEVACEHVFPCQRQFTCLAGLAWRAIRTSHHSLGVEDRLPDRTRALRCLLGRDAEAVDVDLGKPVTLPETDAAGGERSAHGLRARSSPR